MGVSPNFDNYLGKWLESGLLRDCHGYSIEMMKDASSYNRYLQLFLNFIDYKSRLYVSSGSPSEGFEGLGFPGHPSL